jgi:hypothetical protein
MCRSRGSLRRFCRALLPVLLLSPSLFHPPPVHAQTRTRWVIPTTVGYGGPGFTAAYLVSWEAQRAAEKEGREIWDLLRPVASAWASHIGSSPGFVP